MATGSAENRFENRKRHTGGSPSIPQPRKTDSSADRNNASPGKKVPALRTDERHFEMVLDGVPYSIRSIPFFYNDELRFRVLVNGEPGHLFSWDSEASLLRAIDDDASELPSALEEAISERLQSR